MELKNWRWMAKGEGRSGRVDEGKEERAGCRMGG